MESDLSDDSKESFVSGEEDDDEEKATARRSRPRRSSIGLRVAFQFPTKKLAKKADKNGSAEPLFPGSRLQDNKKMILGRKTSCRQEKESEDSASESEDDSRDEGQESSDALLKRTMNIKENKAMVSVRPGRRRRAPGAAPLHSCCSFCQEAYSGFCGFFLFSWTCISHCLTSSGLGRDSQDLPRCPGLTLVTVDQIMLQMYSGLETKKPVPAKGSNM